ncbi:MAG: U32 family peptidase [Clostridiales bacterium]|nr:U32 family peptidase [Clostridiales bacterium]
MVELLAPAGNYDKMVTAFKYGADAVYMAGKKFGLRAFAGNFDENEMERAVEYAHSLGKKVYITLNILANENDFDELKAYVQYLEKLQVDSVLVSDLGVMAFINEYAPKLTIHVSTQASILNSYAIKALSMFNVKRIVLARECSIEEIKRIRQNIPADIELEAFVHGAMCISYSGRCLLSNYLTGRDSNRGECVQACRWEYCISEKNRKDDKYPIQEDERGTYILNSKDLNMLEHLKDLKDAGVYSFKIEGRMKSPYYVANVVNAYRRAIDNMETLTAEQVQELKDELVKTSHRKYTTGFYYGAEDKECLESSYPVQTHEFMALVVGDHDGEKCLIEMRNRFKVGDELEVLSPNQTFNKIIKIQKMENLSGETVEDAKNVQEKLYLYTNLPLKEYDILRKKV